MAATTDSDDTYIFLVSVRLDTAGINLNERLYCIKELLGISNDNFSCIHKFKVTGEPLCIAIYKVPSSCIPTFDGHMREFYNTQGVATECEVLSIYEKFADETLGVSATLTKRESDNYIAGLSPLLWFQATVKFDGKPVEMLKESWKKEAMLFLDLRKNGLKTEVYKVVSQPKVHAFVAMSPQEWDKVSFKLPLNEDDSGAIVGKAKVIQELDTCIF